MLETIICRLHIKNVSAPAPLFLEDPLSFGPLMLALTPFRFLFILYVLLFAGQTSNWPRVDQIENWLTRF